MTSSVERTKNDGTKETLLTQFQYDAQNNLVITTTPDGSVVTNTYDALKERIAVKDKLGLVTQYGYDASGRRIQTTYPDGSTEKTSYDANGNRIATTDRDGHTTSYQYDAVKQLVGKIFADGTKTAMAYDAMGRMVQTVDPLGNATRFTFDAAGRQTSVTDALNQTTLMGYDDNGNRISQTDAKNNVTQYVYDAVGQRTKVIYPDSTSETSVYDANGQVTSVTDQAGKTTLHAYDKLGRLLNTTDATGQVTANAYDEVGNRLSQIDAGGRETLYSYDEMGRRLSRTLPLGQKETYAYDAGGNLTAKTDFNGHVTTYTYDSSYRLTHKTADPFFTSAHLGAAQVSFTYTADGLRASMVDGNGVTTYSYDALHRLAQAATPVGNLSYTYDAAGNETSVASNHNGGASTTYAYDMLNRLHTASDVNGTSTYTFDSVGNTSSLTYPNEIETSFSYDSQNRLTAVSSARNGVTLSEYNYTLEPAGHKTAVQELGGRKAAYAYDSLYRLTSETMSGATAENGTISYVLDRVGNRTQTASSVQAIPTGTANYDSNDRLTADSYDSAGNTTSSGGSTYRYDFENRLVQSGGVTIDYDGDGNRVSKTANGITTSYLVDTRNLTGHSQVLEELQGGVAIRAYSYGLQLLSERQILNGSPVTSFYGFDAIGNVRFLSAANGVVTDTYTYDAFGNVLLSTGSTPNLYRFSGQQFDPDLNLYYNRARYLDPRTSRFRTMDEYEGDAIAPRSLHKYLYAGGNPVSYSDPSGHVFLPSTRGWGQKVHDTIGDDYLSADLRSHCYDTPVVFLTQEPVRGPVTCPARLFGGSGSFGFDRPDLAKPIVEAADRGGEIFEIKSIFSAAEAVAEIGVYRDQLNLLDQRSTPRNWHWHGGNSTEYQYEGENPIILGKLTEAHVFEPAAGVLLYAVTERNAVDVLALASIALGVLLKVKTTVNTARTIGQVFGVARTVQTSGVTAELVDDTASAVALDAGAGSPL